MKTFRMIGIALVAMMFCFTMSSCDDEENEAAVVDPYKDYPQLIVGKWFNFTPDASTFKVYDANGKVSIIGWDKDFGWLGHNGTYSVINNRCKEIFKEEDGSTFELTSIIEVNSEQLVIKAGGNSSVPDLDEKVYYRVQDSFDIKGNYSYLNALARVVPAEGKTALQLPEGVTFNGQNSISIDAMHGERIIEAMKKFFADATFTADGKLNHTMDGEAKEKSYTLDGNNLTFDLYEGGAYKVNATTFPDEDGDRLFIIIPKQAAWLGGMVELVEKENEGLKLDAAQIAALEKEFMETFETFTVILSLSKK